MEYTEVTAMQFEHGYANAQTILFVINCVMKLIITINRTPSLARMLQSDHKTIYAITCLSPCHK